MNRLLMVPVLGPWALLAAGIPGAENQAKSAMPPNAEKISVALVKRGAIPATASLATREAATDSYLKAKMQGGQLDKKANPRARKQLLENEAALNSSGASVNGRKLGNTILVEPSTPQFKPLIGTGKLLVILVEFSNTP
jgi:hypothetical protein